MKKYAGFWQRAKAFGYDYLVISLYLILITLLFLALNSIFHLNQLLFTNRVTAQVSGFLIITLPITLYFSFGESSAKQATWGKGRMGLKVTERNGNWVSFWRALTRTLLKFIPWEISHTLIWNIYFSGGAIPDYANYGFTLIYLLMGLNIASLVMTKTKQSLYDLLTGSFVIKEAELKFHYSNLDTCHTATGVVIVVDVLRAFSTAAYAFSRGAEKIILVSDVNEALLLKSQIPISKAMGEVRGLPPEGFDFGNSPTQIREQYISGNTLIQRTGAGTQGAVRCKNADVLLASSFVVAKATVRYVNSLAPKEVTFVITGETYSGGDEDFACAEYLESQIKGQTVNTKPYIQRVYNCKDAEEHLDPNQPEFPATDLEYCTDIDIFDFAMPITKEDHLLVMRKTRI